MRSIVRSTVLLLSVLLVAFASTGCTKQSRIAKHLKAADRHFQSGDYDRAEVEYRNTLQLDPANASAIARLGIVYFDQGRMGRAAPFLAKAKEVAPMDLDARYRLGATYLALNQPDDARREAEFLLQQDPASPLAPSLLADSVIKPADIAEARRLLQSLPPTAATTTALGALELRENHPAEAEAAFRRALRMDPKFRRAHAALGILYRLQNKPTEAGEEFRLASEGAEPRSPLGLLWPNFAAQSGDHAAAKESLDAILKKTPDYLPAITMRAEIAASENDLDVAMAQIEKLLARDPSHLEGLLMKARLLLAKHQADKAIQSLEQTLKAYPRSAAVYYQLALSNLAIGATGKASGYLTQAVALAPGFAEAVALQAELNIRGGDFGAAVASLEPLYKQRPDLPRVGLLLGEALRGRRDYDAALSIYRQMEKSFPKAAQPNLMEGIVLLQQGKKDDARQALERALGISPGYVPALEQLVSIDLAAGDTASALRRAQAELDRQPKEAQLQLLLARVQMATKSYDAAESTLKQCLQSDPESPAGYLLLSQLYLATKRQDEALKTLDEAIGRNPKDTSSLMLIATLRQQKGEYAAARDAYEKLLVAKPDFGAALNNLAYLYSENLKDLNKAYEMGQRAREILPHEPHTADTFGWILYQRKEYAWAFGVLAEALERLPESTEVQYHYGMAAYDAGNWKAARSSLQAALSRNSDFDGAGEARRRLGVLDIDPASTGSAALEKMASQSPGDPVLQSRLGEAYGREGRVDKAVAAFERAQQLSPKNFSVMLAFAELLASTGQTSRALEIAKSARSLAPSDPDTLRVLGSIALQAGDQEWAFSLLNEASRQNPNDARLAFDLGRAAYSVGQLDTSADAMRRALKLDSLSPEAAEAREFLELSTLAADPEAAASQVGRIDAALAAKPQLLPALAARAAAAEFRKEFDDARTQYERILKSFPQFTPARRQLALLAAAAGDTDKAYELAVKAKESLPNDRALGRLLGLLSYKRNEYARAAVFLQEALRNGGADPELQYYLGMSQLKGGRTADGKQSLRRALDGGLPADLVASARKALAGE